MAGLGGAAWLFSTSHVRPVDEKVLKMTVKYEEIARDEELLITPIGN